MTKRRTPWVREPPHLPAVAADPDHELTCQMCGKQFERASHLARHHDNRKHHPERTPAMTSPHADPKLEALLERHGIAYAFCKDLPLDRIDLEADTQIRDQTDPEVVERYTEALADGALFPAILVRGSLVDEPGQVAGGWHRVLAHVAAGRETIPAYWAEMTDTQALAISVEDNATHGLPLTNAERIRHGIALIEDRGLTQHAAAARVGLSSNMLNRAILRRDGTQRAQRMNVGNQFAQLSESSQGRLQNLGSDVVFAMAVNAAATGRWNTTDVYDLVTELNKTPDDVNTQLMTLSDFAEVKESGAQRGRNWAGEARSAILKTLDIDVARAAKHCKHSDRVHTADQARRAGLTLLELAERLTKA